MAFYVTHLHTMTVICRHRALLIDQCPLRPDKKKWRSSCSRVIDQCRLSGKYWSGSGHYPTRRSSRASRKLQGSFKSPPCSLHFHSNSSPTSPSFSSSNMEAQTTSAQRPGGGGASNGRRRRGAAAGGGTHTCPHCGRTFKRSEHKERHVRTRQYTPDFPLVNLPQIPESHVMA